MLLALAGTAITACGAGDETAPTVAPTASFGTVPSPVPAAAGTTPAAAPSTPVTQPPGPATSIDVEVPAATAGPTETARSVEAGSGGPTPVSCGAATRTVGSADGLTDALASAEPGDVIALAAGTYTGSFVAARSGRPDAPIVLCGQSDAVLDGGGVEEGYVVHVDRASHWRVVGFTVRNGQKGVVVDGATDVVVEGLTVEDIGDEAIHLRSSTTASAVVGNTIRRTGLRREKFGEGVYVGSAESNWERYGDPDGPDRSDGNVVEGNVISETTSEGIDVKEGTTGGRIVGNTIDGSGTTAADSVMDVKGNDWVVEGNVVTNAPEEGIQTHQILEGWGAGNRFRANTIDVRGDGDHVWIHDPDETANVVECDNVTADGDPARSNVECER